MSFFSNIIIFAMFRHTEMFKCSTLCAFFQCDTESDTGDKVCTFWSLITAVTLVAFGVLSQFCKKDHIFIIKTYFSFAL